MKIEITEKGGLRLLVTAEHEWELFEFLVVDAEGRGEGWLAKRLGVLVNDDEWDELVVPGLTEQFQEALAKVREVVRSAFDDSLQVLAERRIAQAESTDAELLEEDECGAVVITREESGQWYSVFNQARLALEGKWKLAEFERETDFEDLDKVDSERLEAFARSRFYTQLQTLLLDSSLEL